MPPRLPGAWVYVAWSQRYGAQVVDEALEAEPVDPPVIGEWYADPQGLLFEVVAIDADDGSVEVQYFDGSVAEFEVEGWEELRPKLSEPPEDLSGSIDMDREDYGVDLDGEGHGMWANPLDRLDR
jgi:hypothetical protein